MTNKTLGWKIYEFLRHVNIIYNWNTNKINKLKEEGMWLIHKIPTKWHHEEKDYYCEECGEYKGKEQITIVDEYKEEKVFIKPPYLMTLNPDNYNYLKRGKND